MRSTLVGVGSGDAEVRRWAGAGPGGLTDDSKDLPPVLGVVGRLRTGKVFKILAQTGCRGDGGGSQAAGLGGGWVLLCSEGPAGRTHGWFECGG